MGVFGRTFKAGNLAEESEKDYSPIARKQAAINFIMSSLKRKEGPGGSSTSNSARPTTESRPSKRPKSSDTPKDNTKTAKKGKDAKSPKKLKDDSEKPVARPSVSLLKEDEPLFPRGGGSVLTPLEQQEIQVQAKKDALFEDKSGSAAGKGEKSGKKKKKKKKRKSEADATPAADPDAVKIESLNFKVRDSLRRRLHAPRLTGNSAL
jgi:rRNA biogenesis protein RRP5